MLLQCLVSEWPSTAQLGQLPLLAVVFIWGWGNLWLDLGFIAQELQVSLNRRHIIVHFSCDSDRKESKKGIPVEAQGDTVLSGYNVRYWRVLRIVGIQEHPGTFRRCSELCRNITGCALFFLYFPKRMFGRLYDSRNEGDSLGKTGRIIRSFTQEKTVLVTALMFWGRSSVLLAKCL